MAKKSKGSQALGIFMVAIFGVVIVAGFIAPILTKDEAADQQAEVDKYLKELQEQQANVESEEDSVKEVDESLKQAGDITQMQIIDITTGTGSEAKLNDKIKVKYRGALASDGSIFDSNSEGVEFELKEGSLIQGWTEGIPGMKVGGKRKLVIPSEKGYGAQGSGSSIPPNADLVFEVELVAVN